MHLLNHFTSQNSLSSIIFTLNCSIEYKNQMITFSSDLQQKVVTLCLPSLPLSECSPRNQMQNVCMLHRKEHFTGDVDNLHKVLSYLKYGLKGNIAVNVSTEAVQEDTRRGHQENQKEKFPMGMIL